MQRPPPHSLNFDHCGLGLRCGIIPILQSTHLFCLEKNCEINKIAATFFNAGFISPQGSSEQLNSNAAIFLR